MDSHFLATVSRMKYIERWALMRNSRPENLSEHSLEVAMIAHALCMIENKVFGGNVNEDSYQSMFNGEKLHHIIENACTECLPMCSECVFQPYCGADPVRNYSEQGDIVGHRPTSDMCKKNTAIMHYLFELLKKHDPEINRIFWSWIN